MDGAVAYQTRLITVYNFVINFAPRSLPYSYCNDLDFYNETKSKFLFPDKDTDICLNLASIIGIGFLPINSYGHKEIIIEYPQDAQRGGTRYSVYSIDKTIDYNN